MLTKPILYSAAVSLGLLLALPAGSYAGETTPTANNSDTASDTPIAEEGFESLFDGQSLKGWDGNPALWSVSDGAILGRSTDESPIEDNEFIIWEGEVADFVLRFEFRIADRGVGNSGVQYRSQRKTEVHRWAVEGYQADIERTNQHMGILYDEGGRGILAARGQKVVVSQTPDGVRKEIVASLGDPAELVADVKAGEWQQYEIVADGNVFTHRINGRETIHVTDNDTDNAEPNGILALQLHRGPAMQIEFRNIRIKHLNQ